MVIIIPLFVSCGGQFVWKDHKQINNDKWLFKDSLEYVYYNYDVSKLKLGLELVAKDHYGYQNIWLKINVIAPDGEQYSALSEFILMDNEGNWYSEKSLWQDKRIFHSEFPQPIDFNQKGKYVFRITQFMREDSLNGISLIGLKLS